MVSTAAATTTAAPTVTAENSIDNGDLPAVVGRPARELEVFGELPALQSGRTRSQSRGLTMSASYTDTLMAYAIRTVEAKRTVEEEATKIERAHDPRLEERLEKEREWPEELERRGTLLEQLKGGQDSDRPLAMAVEQQPEQSIPSPIGRKPNEVESPPHTVAGAERSVFRKGWEQAMRSQFEGHMNTGILSMVDRVPERRKHVSSKFFDLKIGKEEKITKFKARLVARGFTQIRNVDYTHSSSTCPSSASIKLVLAVKNERGLPLFYRLTYHRHTFEPD